MTARNTRRGCTVIEFVGFFACILIVASVLHGIIYSVAFLVMPIEIGSNQNLYCATKEVAPYNHINFLDCPHYDNNLPEERVADWDFWYVARVVAAESRGEPMLGQIAVAQCIRNTAQSTGQTPEEVVKVKNQYAPPVSIDLVDNSVTLACIAVFYEGVSATNEPIRYFYSPAGNFYSAWHEENLQYVMTIGGHKFFKE